MEVVEDCGTCKCVRIVQQCWHRPSLVYSALGSGHGHFSPFERYTLRAVGKGRSSECGPCLFLKEHLPKGFLRSRLWFDL